MTIQFIWSIVQLDSFAHLEGNADVVQLVHWKITGTDGVHTATAAGATHIPYVDEGSAFTEYKALTEAEVLNWVKAELDKPMPIRPGKDGEESKRPRKTNSEDYEAVVTSMIAEAAAADTKPVPWA